MCSSDLDPGAETASGIAALLETARHLSRDPPGRQIRFLALSAHFQDRQGIAHFLDRRRRELDDAGPADLLIGLDLSGGSDEAGFWNNTESYDVKRFFLPYARLFSAHGAAVAEELGRDPDRALVNGFSPLRGRDWASYVPHRLHADGEVALLAGVPSLMAARKSVV